MKMKLHEIQKTETKLFDLYAEIINNQWLYVKLKTENELYEFEFPMEEDTYWKWDDLWDDYVEFHCDNCDDPTYWFSGGEDAKELNKFNLKLWRLCGVKG